MLIHAWHPVLGHLDVRDFTDNDETAVCFLHGASYLLPVSELHLTWEKE